MWGSPLWLAASRKAAIGFYPCPDRLILRVATDKLDVSKLMKNLSWRRWLVSLRGADAEKPPADLLRYLARLSRFTDKERADRLLAAAAGTVGDPAQLRKDLRTQIARVRPDQLMEYTGRIPPHALSRANEAGFYSCLKIEDRGEGNEAVNA